MCVYVCAIAFPKKKRPRHRERDPKNHLPYMEPEKVMKHSEWLRLKKEGENICSILRQQNYPCLKQTRRLTWKILIPLSPSLPTGETGGSYLLTWLPAPVSDWSLIPNDSTPAREKLMHIVKNTLNTINTGEVLLPSPIAPNPQRGSRVPHSGAGTGAPSLLPTPQQGDFSRPWAIVRLLPDLRRYTVARFYNRTDAQDHLRFLNRFMPAAEFEVIFDVPSEVESTASLQ